MIKKIFLLLCFFICLPDFVNAEVMNFDSSVGESVARKYFEHMKTEPANNDKFPIPSQWTDKHIFLNVLRQYKYCLEENRGRGVTSDCIIDNVCQGAFSHIPSQNVTSKILENAKYYCDKYGTALVETKPNYGNPNCRYNVDRIGYWQDRIIFNDKSGDGGFYRDGGSISWRVGNPGNMTGRKDACARIKVRFTNKDTGKIETRISSVYDDEKDGWESLKNLLVGNKYKNETISRAMEIYAPAGVHGNKPKQYANDIKKRLKDLKISGRDYDKLTIQELNERELEQMMIAIRTHEGYKVGTIECFDTTGAIVNCPSNIK